MKKDFNQTDYNMIVDRLDAAYAIFVQTSDNPESAFKDFINNHYFPLWRAINEVPVP